MDIDIEQLSKSEAVELLHSRKTHNQGREYAEELYKAISTRKDILSIKIPLKQAKNLNIARSYAYQSNLYFGEMQFPYRARVREQNQIFYLLFVKFENKD